MKIITSHIVNEEIVKETHDIENQEFTAIVHPQGLHVDAPECVEINPQNTIECIQEMSQAQWEWISQGKLFNMLWEKSFDPQDFKPPVKNIEILKLSDMGLKHIAGMIILGCETCMAGKNIFFRNPETYLHPRTERYIVGMIQEMQKLFNGKGGKAVKDAPKEIQNDDTNDAINWFKALLAHYGPEKEIFSINGKRGTVTEAINQINQKTEIGLQLINNFLKLKNQ